MISVLHPSVPRGVFSIITIIWRYWNHWLRWDFSQIGTTCHLSIGGESHETSDTHVVVLCTYVCICRRDGISNVILTLYKDLGWTQAIWCQWSLAQMVIYAYDTRIQLEYVSNWNMYPIGICIQLEYVSNWNTYPIGIRIQSEYVSNWNYTHPDCFATR